MRALTILLISIALNLIMFGVLLSYSYYYGGVTYHKDLCEQRLIAENAPRNVKCVLAKEVFVPDSLSN